MQNQNIDGLINGIRSISKNRCSLSDEEVRLLNECVLLLETMKKENSRHRKRSTFLTVLGILIRIFGSDIHKWFDDLMK